MQSILKGLSSSKEGKKKLLCIYHVLKSDNVDKLFIKKYLNLKNSNITPLELKGKKIKYEGELLNIFSFDTFKNVYLDPDAITPYRKIASNKNKKPPIWHLSKLIEKDYKYGIKISPPSSEYIWVTNAEHKTLKPSHLGVDTLSERDVVGIEFPKKIYTLNYPTIIEGYGVHNSGWHYPNIDYEDTWGKAINIDSIEPGSNEDSICGKPEALLKSETFTPNHKIVALEKDQNTEEYYKEKYEIFLDEIEQFYDKYEVLDYIQEELDS